MKLVTNDCLRRGLGRWIQRAEAGEDVVVVNIKERRSRVRLVVVKLELDFDALEETEEIYL